MIPATSTRTVRIRDSTDDRSRAFVKVDRALVAGANVITSPRTYVAESAAGMLSRRGLCEPFDDQADGFVRGEGVVAVVLQRLGDAQDHGAEIHAIVSGVATNHSRRSAANLTSPSPSAQDVVIRAALADASIGPDRVAYIEAHGTGTRLGEPIEIRALQNVFDGPEPRDLLLSPVLIGASKATVGHTESVAGLVGLLKAVLALKHTKAPPLSHIGRLNEHLGLGEASRLNLPKQWTELQLHPAGLVAGVSSFGFSGVNSHAILCHSGQEKKSSYKKTPLLPKLVRSWFPLTSVSSAAGVEVNPDSSTMQPKTRTASFCTDLDLTEKFSLLGDKYQAP